MIEQIGNAVKFAAFFTAAKQGKTGITVTVDVYNPAGTLVVAAGAASALGGGIYTYVLASGSVTTEGEYYAVFKTTDSTVDAQHVPALWVVGRAGIEDLDVPVSSRNATAPDNTGIAAIKVKTDTLPANPAATSDIPGTSAISAAVWAASSRRLSALGVQDIWDALQSAMITTGSMGEWLASLVAPNNAGIAAIKAVSDKLGTALEFSGAAWRYTVAALANAPAGGGGGTTDWTAGEREQIRDALGVAGTKTTATGGQLQAVKAKADIIPANPAATSDIPGTSAISAAVWAASSRRLSALGVQDIWDALKSAMITTGSMGEWLAGLVAPNNAGIAAIKAVSDKLDTALELSGAAWRYTVAALANAPAGGGGGTTDWTAGEREQIRDALGVAGTKTTATGGQLQAVKAKADTLPANPAATSDIPGTSAISAAVWAASSRRLSALGVQDIWDALKSAMTTTGSMGEWLAGLAAPNNAGIAAIKAVSDKLDTALEFSGAAWRFTIAALFNAPAGGGGSGGAAPSAAQNAAALLAVTKTELLTYDPETTGRAFAKLLIGTPDTPVTPIPGTTPAAGTGRVFIYTAPFAGSTRAGIKVEIMVDAYPAKVRGFVREIRPMVMLTDSTGFAALVLPFTDEILPAGRVYVMNCAALGWSNIRFELTAAMLDGNGNFDLATLVV